jgi:hypothetical protein
MLSFIFWSSALPVMVPAWLKLRSSQVPVTLPPAYFRTERSSTLVDALAQMMLSLSSVPPEPE